MKSNKSKTIEADWSEFLNIERLNESIPEGYYDCEQIAEQIGITTTRVRERMRRLRDKGKVEYIKVKTSATPKYCYKMPK